MTWRVPGYVAEQLIGYGSSSDVWRGRSTRAGRAVALKRIAVMSAADADAARVEVEILRRLDHPHLIRIHDVVSTSGAVVIVLDLADAGSLDDLLMSRGRLTPGEVASAISPIGAALAYAHSHHVVHGDVSAGNVLFTAIGLPLLADLGMGRISGPGAMEPVGLERFRCTPAYVSPDVAGGGVAQATSDVFSLAAVAFHAVTGVRVWPGSDGEQLLARASQAELVDVDAVLASAKVPETMSSALAQALSIEPHRRPTAAQVALELRLSVELSGVDLAAGRPRPQPRPSVVGRHRRTTSTQPVPSHPGRPQFETAPKLAPDRGQLTHGLRLAPIEVPTLPRWWRGRPKSVATVIASVSIMALVAAGGFLLLARPAHDRAVVATESGPAGALHTLTSSAVQAQAGDGSTELADALVALDGLRQRAFAERRPELLEQVYGSAQLRTRDAAMIAALVPPGCGLIGVHTTYRDVRRVAITPDGVVVSTSAALASSTLRCGAADAGGAAGLAATPLQITLVRGGPHYLISSVVVGG